MTAIIKTFIVSLFLLPFIVHAQNITLFAGGGSAEGDGGPAISALIFDPGSGVFDKYGNYYFASDLGGSKIRKIDVSGTITTIAGTGVLGYNGDGIPATSAQLCYPDAVTLDTAGDLFFCEGGGPGTGAGNRIRKIDMTTGIITTYAGSGTGSFSGDGGLATSATIFNPQDICFDKVDNLYIADYSNYRIRKVTTDGIITTIAGNGYPGYSGDGLPADTSRIGGVAGICVDTMGNLYFGDNVNGRVFKIGIEGNITTIAGTDTGYLYNGDEIPATTANIDPNIIRIDRFGFLYIGEDHNYRVRKVDAAGIIHTVAGNGIYGNAGNGGPATEAEIDKPSGLAFDVCNNLYIAQAESSGHIRKVAFNPTCDTDYNECVSNVIWVEKISIYPNPAYSTITIESSAQINTVTIANIIGEVVEAQKYNKEKVEMSITNLPAGVYFVKVNEAYVQKIVKQ